MLGRDVVAFVGIRRDVEKFFVVDQSPALRANGAVLVLAGVRDRPPFPNVPDGRTSIDPAMVPWDSPAAEAAIDRREAECRPGIFAPAN